MLHARFFERIFLIESRFLKMSFLFPHLQVPYLGAKKSLVTKATREKQSSQIN